MRVCAIVKILNLLEVLVVSMPLGKGEKERA